MKYHPIYDSLIAILESLSNPDYQERIWLNKAGPEYSSYLECKEEFSEVSNWFLHNEELGKLLDANHLKLLKNLSQEFDAFHRKIRDRDLANIHRVLTIAKWHKIQKLSKELYEVLSKSRK